MASYIKNLLKQLPFYEKTIKAKIKQLTTKKLLQEQPFYKESINDDINISRKERTLRGYAEAYKVEIINNRNLSDLLPVSKKSIKNLFNKLLREKKGFKYIISIKITLKK